VHPVWARMGPFYIFRSNCMSYTVLELCEKINLKSLNACLWQAVKNRPFFLVCRFFLVGTVHCYTFLNEIVFITFAISRFVQDRKDTAYCIHNSHKQMYRSSAILNIMYLDLCWF